MRARACEPVCVSLCVRASRPNAPALCSLCVSFIFWVADWFALMNDKMGGDLEKIKTVGQYLIQVCVWTVTPNPHPNPNPDLEKIKTVGQYLIQVRVLA